MYTSNARQISSSLTHFNENANNDDPKKINTDLVTQNTTKDIFKKNISSRLVKLPTWLTCLSNKNVHYINQEVAKSFLSSVKEESLALKQLKKKIHKNLSIPSEFLLNDAFYYIDKKTADSLGISPQNELKTFKKNISKHLIAPNDPMLNKSFYYIDKKTANSFGISPKHTKFWNF